VPQSAAKPETDRTIAVNRKATHDYDLFDRYEAGIVLTGTEIKSVRAGRVNLRDAYVRVEGGEAWLLPQSRAYPAAQAAPAQG
jgi:SsrA-binding protein